MYNEFGLEKTVGLIKSNASTFDVALMVELNETTAQFEGKWKAYLIEKFEASQSPSPTPIIPEITPLTAVAVLAVVTFVIALTHVNCARRKNA